MFVLVLARVLVCICECWVSESILDHDCVTLRHRGKDIKSRCGLLTWEYVGGGGWGLVLKGVVWVLGKTFPHYWLLILWYVWAISGVLKPKMINYNGRGEKRKHHSSIPNKIGAFKSRNTSCVFVATDVKLVALKLQAKLGCPNSWWPSYATPHNFIAFFCY